MVSLGKDADSIQYRQLTSTGLTEVNGGKYDSRTLPT